MNKLLNFVCSFFLSCIFIQISLQGEEKSDSFIVKIFDGKVNVVTPERINKNVSVIIENKTLTKVLGKVVTEKGILIEYLAINGNEFKSIKLDDFLKDKIFYISISPPFQEIELKSGVKSYEIPPKK